MVNLRYKGRSILLFPGTEITWEVADDFLDYESIGSGYSWPIRIPREGNEWIFHHAGDADHQDNLFKTYDGFEITISGNVWWSVSFDLTEATTNYYSGSLTSINKAFFEAKNKKIADLVTGQVQLSAGTYNSVIRPINELNRSDIRFPWIHFYGTRLARPDDDYTSQSDTVGTDQGTNISQPIEILSITASNSGSFRVDLSLDVEFITAAEDFDIQLKVNGTIVQEVSGVTDPDPILYTLGPIDIASGDVVTIWYVNLAFEDQITVYAATQMDLISNDRKPYQLINTSDMALLPTFRAGYILQLILQGIGISLRDAAVNYSGGDDPLYDLLLLHNRIKEYDISSGATIDIADHLPDITLIELIRDLCIYRCCSAHISSDQTTLELRSFDRDVNTSTIRTSLALYDPDVQVNRADYNNIRLTFDTRSDDLTKNTPEVLTGQYRGEFATYTDWIALSSPAKGDYGYVRQLGQYLRIIDSYGSLISAFYAYPMQPYESGADDQVELTPTLLPVTKDRYFYHVLEGTFTITDMTGYLKISGFGNWADFPDDGDRIQIIEAGQDPIYASEGFAEIYSVDINAKEIALNISYIDDTQVSKIIIRKSANAAIPIIGADIHWPEGKQDNPGFKGRIMMWHGVVATEDAAGTYPYASADGYDVQGNQIARYSLMWSGPGTNLVDQLWSSFVSFVKSARYITIDSFEGVHQVRTLFEQKTARLIKGAIRIKRIRTTLSGKGLIKSQLHTYSVVGF